MTRYLLIFFLVSLTLGSIDISGNYFCYFECGVAHTACSRAPCGMLKDTCLDGRSLQLNNSERRTILEEHNYLRANVCSKATKELSCANMRVMSYSKELEFVAQCWSNACIIGHDSCNMVKDFEEVGQNMYYFEQVDDPDSSKYLKEVVKEWAKEETLLDDKSIFTDYVFKESYSNFTQLIWAETNLVGCGRTAFSKGLYIVCNYAVEGNSIGGAICDTDGSPCSKCDRERCNRKYRYLCGLEQLDDGWDPPFMLSCAPSLDQQVAYRTKTRVTRTLYVILLLYLYRTH